MSAAGGRRGPGDARIRLAVGAAVAAAGRMQLRDAADALARALERLLDGGRLYDARWLLDGLADYWPLAAVGDAALERQTLIQWLGLQFERWNVCVAYLGEHVANPVLRERLGERVAVVSGAADDMRRFTGNYRAAPDQILPVLLRAAIALTPWVEALMLVDTAAALVNGAQRFTDGFLLVQSAVAWSTAELRISSMPLLAVGVYAYPLEVTRAMFRLIVRTLDREIVDEDLALARDVWPMLVALIHALRDVDVPAVQRNAAGAAARAGLLPRAAGE